MWNKKRFIRLMVGLTACTFLNSHTATISAQTKPAAPALQTSQAASRRLLTLEANPPEGTKAVRFYIDDMRFSELTSLYAEKTKTAPVWKTVIDPAWLESGEHDLRIEAVSSVGVKTIATRKIQGTNRNTPEKTMLTGAWEFAEMSDLPAGALEGDVPAAAQPGYRQGTWTRIFVPNSLGAVNDKWNKYEGILGMYRRTVDLDFTTDEQVHLVLRSCYWSGRVFINGVEVGETHGGYLPSRFPVTKAARKGKNDIAILVDNRLTSMGVFKRLNEFYWNWGGLDQEVYLEKHPQVSLTDLRAEGTISGNLQLHLTGLNATAVPRKKTISIEVYNAARKKVAGPVQMDIDVPAGETIIKLKPVRVNSPVLWNMENPYLYTVVVKGAFATLQERTGFREVKVKGRDVFLNGKPVEGLQGFNRHADYPGLGRTQPGALAYQELKALRDKGFRFFRPAHYPTTPEQLDAADELGLLVIEEVNVTGLKGAVMASKEVKEFGAQQLSKMIHRDRSHPSIIAWSVGNENLTEEEGAADYVKEVIALGRSLDPDRLYTQVTHRHTNDKTFEYQDIIAQNYYAGWYAKDVNAIVNLLDAIQAYAGNKPIMLSEYGAEAVSDRKGTAKSTEFYQGFVVDAHNRLLHQRKHFIGKMYWCSTEFWCRPNWHGGSPDPVQPFHVKSLISLNREHKKLGWRVMFSPVRLLFNPHTVKGNDLGGDVLVSPDKDTTISQVITLREIKGVPVKGKILLELAEGFESANMEYPFELKPGEARSFTITINGRLASPAQAADCFIRAVVDEDTEAQPLLLTLKNRNQVVAAL